MEYINIISKEAITEPLKWPSITIGIIVMVIVFAIWISPLFIKPFDFSKGIGVLSICGFGGIVLMLLSYAICAIFFRVPTGQYEYKATIDKDNITVSEYEEFIEIYNPTIIDGVYYWEGE